MFLHEMPHQHRNIVLPLPQRRHRDLQHRQPVIQILPETAVPHRLLQIAVGRGNQADIHLDGMDPAHAFELTLLQHPQQLHLQRGSQFADFVEKNHASIGHFQPAFLQRSGSGKCSTLVAEQIAFQKRLWNRGAIDGHKRLARPRTVTMQGPRRQLFAGPALALDQHGRIGGRHALQELINLFHALRPLPPGSAPG